MSLAPEDCPAWLDELSPEARKQAEACLDVLTQGLIRYARRDNWAMEYIPEATSSRSTVFIGGHAAKNGNTVAIKALRDFRRIHTGQTKDNP